MTETQYIPLLAGLVGALIGSVTSIATIYIQQRAQNKRERANQIFQAATEQFKLAIEVAKIRGNGAILPFATFLHHHKQLYELLENSNLNANSLKKIHTEEDEIERLYKENT
jgi:hypothetical protein